MRDACRHEIRRRHRRAGLALALLLAAACLPAAVTGCARRAAEPTLSRPLAVQVYADTARTRRLSVPLPAARVWLAQVAPARVALSVPVPPAGSPDSLPPAGDAGPGLDVDPGLKPPVLRTPARLMLAGGTAGWVDLDVRVDENGSVSDALWVAGSGDTTLAEAARGCALSMRFYPALRAGRAVAVWCRQRFDLRSPAPPQRAGPAVGR
mgnify:CR=1 FL=1